MHRAGVPERMVHAGEDLNASALEWGRRDQAAPTVLLTDRDLRLMALLHDVNFLSASQLLMLGWGESGGSVGLRRLKRLHDAGYLDRFRPVTVRGSAEWNYRVSARGWSELNGRELTRSNIVYRPAVITSISYTEHDLQLATLVLRLAREANRCSGGLIESMPFTWRGPRSGRIDFGRRKSDPPIATTLPPGTRLHPGSSRQGYLEPDATLIALAGAGIRAVLLEYDRTDRPHKEIDRLRRYDRWLLDGWRQGDFAAEAAAPTVLFVTAREKPLRRLVETADKTFSAWHGHRRAGPREGTHPARQRVMFTSRERILVGDWRMELTPRLPPALRDNRSACSPRSVTYDLPRLFGVLEPRIAESTISSGR